MVELPYGLEPDERMQHFNGGFDGTGRPLPLTPESMRRVAGDWPTCEATPDSVAGLLKTSRDLFVLSFLAYEVLTVGALLSLQAVEAGLKVRLARERGSLADLIKRAEAAGFIDAETAERINYGRKLRNEFSHPTRQTVWSYGMTADLLRSSHQIIDALFGGGLEATPDESA